MKTYGNIDSKFRFVILAAKRAKMLLKGAKPKIKTKSKNAIRIAQNELRMGLVDYKILKPKKEEFEEPEDKVFLGGEDIGGAVDEEEEEEKLEKVALEEKEEEEKEEEEEAEEELEEELHEEIEGLDEELPEGNKEEN